MLHDCELYPCIGTSTKRINQQQADDMSFSQPKSYGNFKIQVYLEI